MFGIFKKKEIGGFGGKELKKKLYSLRSKRINCVYTDLKELIGQQRLDETALLSLAPVNYYALKPQYIEAHYFYSEDYSECYVKFTSYDNDKVTGESEIFAIPAQVLAKAFAKVGIIVTLPVNGQNV